MNKFKIIILAILGGINVIVDIATPLILVLIWQGLFGLQGFGGYLFYAMGLLASIWRAIKIGWLKKHE